MILQYYFRIMPDRQIETIRAYSKENAKKKLGDGKSVAVFGPFNNDAEAWDEARRLKALMPYK